MAYTLLLVLAGIGLVYYMKSKTKDSPQIRQLSPGYGDIQPITKLEPKNGQSSDTIVYTPLSGKYSGPEQQTTY